MDLEIRIKILKGEETLIILRIDNITERNKANNEYKMRLICFNFMKLG